MPESNNNPKNGIKNFKVREAAFPAIWLIFFVLLGITFFHSVNFLTKKFNKPLSLSTSDIGQQLVELDLEKFESAKAIVNFKEEIFTVPSSSPDLPNSALPENSTTTPPDSNTSTVPENSVVPPASEPLKKLELKIEVYNSTKTPKLAAELKTVLEKENFVVAKTGNIQPETALTEIRLSPKLQSSQPLAKELTDAIKKSYPDAVTVELPENENLDAVVIIGKN